MTRYVNRLVTILLLLVPVRAYCATATGVSGGTTLTNSASLAAALSDETGTGAAVFASTPTLVSPILGTPTSGTLTTCTGLPISTGVSGLGTGVATWAATPSSANLASAITDETGSGALAFATSPTFTTQLTVNGGGASILTTDAANAFAVRNGTSAQKFRVYNTFTDSSNGRWVEIAAFNATDIDIQTNGNGTGASGGVLYFGSAGTRRWGILTTGHLQPNSDNTYDVGDSTHQVRSAYVATSIQGGNSKSLTESSATAFVQVAVASGSYTGGCIHYTIHADDGTNFQSISGTIHFSMVNKAGTETATVTTPSAATETPTATSSGTLSVSFDTDTSPTNAVNIRANAVSSLTQTTLKIEYRVEIFGPATTVTPQ
jgi:hypothetical protein